MRRSIVAVVIALSSLVTPGAMAAEDPTCNLPVKPSWCTP